MLDKVIRSLIGLKTEHVVASKSLGSFFTLDFGREITIADEGRKPYNSYEYSLNIYCAWRIVDAHNNIICSDLDSAEDLVLELKKFTSEV